MHPYLLPLPSNVPLSNAAKAALDEIEADFALDGPQLDDTVKQMLWEFSEGLKKHATEKDRDTFLPMM